MLKTVTNKFKMLSYHVLVLILAVISRLSFIAGEDQDPKVATNPLEPPKIEALPQGRISAEQFSTYRKEACGNVPAFGASEQNAKWSDTLTLGEIYELALLNMGYGLTADAIGHLPIDLGWRKVLIDQMSYISRTSCDTEAVSSMFMNAVKNLFLYYMVKMEKNLEKEANVTRLEKWKAEKHNETWTEIINSLSKCAADVDPIIFEDDCSVVTGYIDEKGMSHPTDEVEEQFDIELSETEADGLDYIVDGVWWMFTGTFARCYAHFYPNEDIMLLFLQRFREDIMSFFLDRWRGAGELEKQFDVVFGPFMSQIQLENLRKCSTSAFGYEGLKGRHLVRPVIVTVDKNKVKNYKTDSFTGNDKDKDDDDDDDDA